MSRKKPRSPLIERSEQQAFQETMEALPGFKKMGYPEKIRPDEIPKKEPFPKVSMRTDDRFYEAKPFYPALLNPPLHSESQVHFKRSGLLPRQWKQLQKGGLLIDEIADLHGLTTDQALRTCQELLRTAKAREQRVLLIIHGKGNPSTPPPLKNTVTAFFMEHPCVLALSSAPPALGGTGALLVLLRDASFKMRDD